MNQRVRSESDLPRGQWAHGAINDYVLRSDSVHAVIGGFPRESDADTVAPFRFGALLDIVPNFRHADGFGYLMPRVIRSGDEIMLQDPAIEFATGTAGNASIRVRRASAESEATFNTDFWLGGDTPGLLIESQLNKAPDDWAVEDRIAWGEFDVFVPGVGYGMPDGVVVHGVEFLLGTREGDAIILIPEEGTLTVRREGALTSVAYDEPGDDAVRRWLLVGENGAELLSWFMQSQRANDSALLAGRVMEHASDVTSGASWTRGAGRARMMLALPSTDGSGRSYLPFVTRSDGGFELAVPAGQYLLVPDQYRSGSHPGSLRVAVAAGSRAENLDFTVSAFPIASINIVEDETGYPMAARLHFRRLDGADVALSSTDLAPRSRNELLVWEEHGRVFVPPGDYEIRATCGIEYQPLTTRVTVNEEAPMQIQLRPKRAFDTPGWLAGDLASRTDKDPHGSATLAHRIASARAEGLEWFAPGDPEISWTAAQPPVLNSWMDKATPRDGLSVLRLGPELGSDVEPGIWSPSEVEWRTVTALPMAEQVALLRQANVAGLAVWDASIPDAFGTRFQYLQALRDNGLELLPLGISNAIGLFGGEIGYPRVYVEADEATDMRKSLLDGRYQVTNGPFVDVRVNGAGIDGPVETRDGVLDFDLRIHAVDEVSVARVTVLVNGRLTRQLLFNETLRESGSGLAVPMPTDPEAGKFRLNINRDCIIDLVIEGDEARPNPLVSPRGSPFAETNADRGTLSRAFLAPIHVKFSKSEETTP